MGSICIDHRLLKRVHHVVYAGMVIISIILKVSCICELHIFSTALKCANEIVPYFMYKTLVSYDIFQKFCIQLCH